MEARHAERIEEGANALAAALLAAAVAYAAVRLGVPAAGATAGAAATFFCCWRALQSVQPEAPSYALEPFELAPLPQAVDIDELVLTEADRLAPAEPQGAEHELVLDDVLAELGEDSRVVRLFDPAAMPSPGELRTRISNHLDGSDASLLSPDASQALHDALSELRRSLK